MSRVLLRDNGVALAIALGLIVLALVGRVPDLLGSNNEWSSDCTTVNDATPTPSDDLSRAYLPGCTWIDQTGNAAYIAEDTTDGAANWLNVSTSGIEATTYVVCASTATNVGRCDYTADGTADDVQIQAALDALTTSRTWQETVALVGQFSISATLEIHAYTILDARQSLLKLTNSANVDLLRNENWNGQDGVDPEDSYVTLLGGIWDGNRANQDGTTNKRGIYLRRVPNLLIDGVTVKDVDGHGLQVTGRSDVETNETTQDHKILNTWVINSRTRNYSIQNAVRNTIVMNAHSRGGDAVGFWMGHSEGQYIGLDIEGAGTYGLQINNVRNITMDDLRIRESGQHGAYVIGFVDSVMTNAKITRSSTSSAGTYSDLYLDADDSWSYGVTKNAVFNGKFGEDHTDAGGAQAKAAIEFEDAGTDVPGTAVTPKQEILINGYINAGGATGTKMVLPAAANRGSIHINVMEEGSGDPPQPRNNQTVYGGRVVETRAITTDDLYAFDQFVTVATTGGARTPDLPTAARAGAGHEITIVKSSGGANTVTIAPVTGEMIDAVVDGTVVLTNQRDYVTLRSDGVDNWDIIASRP